MITAQTQPTRWESWNPFSLFNQITSAGVGIGTAYLEKSRQRTASTLTPATTSSKLSSFVSLRQNVPSSAPAIEAKSPRSTPSAPTTFHPFPRLPAELRLLVWSAYRANTPPQLIPISFTTLAYDHYFDTADCTGWPHIFTQRRAIPAILHVNSESRLEALNWYSCGFAVSQSLGSEGCFWPEEDGSEDPYACCEHEKERGDKDDFTYWDREKDIIWLDLDQPVNEKAATLWSAKCDIRFPNVRWLGLSMHNLHLMAICPSAPKSNTVFTGMEAVFVMHGSGRYATKPLVECYREDAIERIKEGMWEGKGGALPEVVAVSDMRSITGLVEKRY